MPTKPAGAKTPQDHQPKTEKPKVEKIEVTIGEGDSERSIPAKRVTIDGLTVTIQDRALNDYRVIQMLARGGEGNAMANARAMDLILGEDQHNTAAKHFEDEDGYIDQEAFGKFTGDLFSAVAPNS